jgi:hypothetical protein
LTNCFYVAISIATSVIVLKVHYKGQETCQPVPIWVTKLLFLRTERSDRSKRAFADLIKLDSFGRDTFGAREKPTTSPIKNKINVKQLYLKQLNDKFERLVDELEECQSEIEIMEHLADEWKLVARRIDRIFLVLSLITTFSLPIILWTQFRFEITYTNYMTTKSCACSPY